MKNSLVTLFASVFVIVSCSINEIDYSPVSKETKTIYASTEVDTKTTLSDNINGVYKVIWSEGDQIALIDEGGYTAVFVTDEGAKSKSLFKYKNGKEDLDFENGVIAGYPVENIYLNSSDPKVPVFITIPSVQEYNGNTFSDNVMPMVSDITTGNDIQFNNAAGVIRLNVSASEDVSVKSITIRSQSQYISGKCGYIPDTKQYFFDQYLDSENNVKLSCGEGVIVGKEATSFMIVVPHQEYTSLQIVVKTVDGYEQTFTMKSDKTLKVKRSSVSTIPLYIDDLVKSKDNSADIQFEPYYVNWSYRYYDRGNGCSRYFNTEDTAQMMLWKSENNGNEPYFNYPEIKIDSSRVRIDLLEDSVPDNDVHEIDFRIDRNSNRVDIKAYDLDGNEIVYGADGVTPFLNQSHFIVLDALTSDVAKLTEVNLPFTDFPVTYKARKYVINYDNKMKYSIAFDITLGATPKDKEIDLGSFSITYTQAHINKVPVNPITKAVAADADAFADLPVHSTYDFAGTVGPWNDTWTRVSWNEKDYGYLELRSTAGYNNIAFTFNPSSYAIEEDAYLEIPQNAEYDTSYALQETWSFYGIEYTFNAEVYCQRPYYSLVPNPRFVKDGIVELSGKVDYPLYANGTYKEAGNYELNKINLRDYVHVEGMSQTDKLYNELQLSYKVKETRFDNSIYTAPLGVSFIENYEPAVLSASQWAYNAYFDAQNNYVEKIDEMMLYWNSVDQYPYNSNPYETINEVVVEYQLLSHDGEVKFGDPVELTLVVPELLKFETTKTLTQPWKRNDVPTVTNIYQALKITDTKNNIQISNPNATSANDFFDYIYTENKKTVTADDVRNVYNISIVPDATKVKAYLKSGIPLTANDYVFNPVTGEVQLPNNSGNITENIVVEIPVSMYHMYQGSHAHSVVVKVEFTK